MENGNREKFRKLAESMIGKAKPTRAEIKQTFDLDEEFDRMETQLRWLRSQTKPTPDIAVNAYTCSKLIQDGVSIRIVKPGEALMNYDQPCHQTTGQDVAYLKAGVSWSTVDRSGERHSCLCLKESGASRSFGN
jgi:hypothetical protein